LNAVRRAIQGLPVKVKMEQVPNNRPGGKPFNALVVEAVGVEPVSEGASDDGDE
jgi:hypothetical protein